MYLTKCLDIKKYILGEKHADLSPCYVVLGNLSNDKCDYIKASEYY